MGIAHIRGSAIGVVLALVSLTASATVATLGPENDCDYVTNASRNAVQDALADGKRDLRLTATAVNHGSAGFTFGVASERLRIRGGYASCAAAAADTPRAPDAPYTQWRVAQGVTGLAAISFAAMDWVHELELSGIRFVHASDAPPFAPNGGALVIHGRIAATLERLYIPDFRAVERGGALLVSGNARVTLRDVGVWRGQASRGGGIACENAILTLDARTVLHGNQAQTGASSAADAGYGGAIYLDDCHLYNEARTPAAGGFHAIANNFADVAGGGIAARNSTILMLGGDLCESTYEAHCVPGLVSIVGNAAGVKGGGLYLGNSDAALYLVDISHNHARAGAGGGILLETESWLTLEGAPEFLTVPQMACEGALGCTRLRNNRAGDAGIAAVGGGIAVDDGFVEAFDTVFEDNQAASGSALALLNFSEGVLHQSVAVQREVSADHPVQSLISLGPDTELDMLMSTLVADVASAAPQAGLVKLADGAQLASAYNVLFARGLPMLVMQPTSDAVFPGCNGVSHAVPDSFPNTFLITAADFADPSRPLEPARDGALVDACVALPGLVLDITGRPRVVALNPGAEATPQDAGAFEVQRDTSIFSDGFEVE